MKVISNRSLPVVLAASLLGFAPSAFAYLDPSTGSMILSAVVGILATLGLAIKTYWYKLKSFFSGKQEDSSVEPVTAPDEEQQADGEDRTV
jgi:hypothetical protein